MTFLTSALLLIACGGQAEKPAETLVVDDEGIVVAAGDSTINETALPYSDASIREHVVNDYGKHAVRLDADATISQPRLMKNKQKCFIVMSKKDYYLYVYEAQGKDTVLLARYDCCFALKKGNKQKAGDMRTPHCTMKNPFSISQIVNASTWHHDFKDGRGNIKAYGDWFLRLVTPGHRGIGIHGSTNNRASVPGRASEGCIRLRDEDIVDLRKNYVFNGMKVVIKAEDVDDYPFEVRAMKKQNIKRLRHIDPKQALSNDAIAKATPEKGYNGSLPKSGGKATASEEVPNEEQADANLVASNEQNKTLEELEGKSKPTAAKPEAAKSKAPAAKKASQSNKGSLNKTLEELDKQNKTARR